MDDVRKDHICLRSSREMKEKKGKGDSDVLDLSDKLNGSISNSVM
jgi:hypothetical protein